MAAGERQVNTPLLENILSQPAALRGVAQHHLGVGESALTQAAALLLKSKRVVISGMGASFFASLPFAYALSARGVCVVTLEASELLYFLDAQISTDSAVLLVSRSGESVEVAKLLVEARRRGASVLGVTNVPESTLGRESDHAIFLASPPDELVAIQTYVATVATLALLSAAMDGELSSAGPELGQLAHVLERWLPECVQARAAWSEFLEPRGAIYLLGRGPTMGSVAEGALLMHETAKATAVGMSVAQFRHGPVEVVEAGFRAILFGTQAATAALDASLASDLLRMGGKVRWIGPAHPEAGVAALCHWPQNIPARFLPIAEILPLQLAAYRKAELVGVRPGAFRWAPAITATEAGFPIAAQQ